MRHVKPHSPLTTPGLAIVCVNFDAETPALKSSAISLAQRTGVALRFVHVLESTIGAGYVADMPLYNVSAALVHETMAQLQEEREASMKTLLSDVPAGVVTSTALLTGDAPWAIIHDAEAHGASLIMTACNLEHYSQFIPKGFSVALRLMAEAPLPVLVSSRARSVDFGKQKMNFLVADDLQPGTEEAVRKTCELAKHLVPCRIRQLHIHGDFREALQGNWRDLAKKYPTLQKFGDSPDDVIRAESEARIAEMHKRGGRQRELAAARGISIEVDVCTGNVAENLKEAIDDVDRTLGV